ncbi:MAG TPA: hypothetical protein VGM27_20320, partial [Acidobacteriaceae bacterium]
AGSTAVPKRPVFLKRGFPRFPRGNRSLPRGLSALTALTAHYSPPTGARLWATMTGKHSIVTCSR